MDGRRASNTWGLDRLIEAEAVWMDDRYKWVVGMMESDTAVVEILFVTS
jgi:hypothetical protein